MGIYFTDLLLEHDNKLYICTRNTNAGWQGGV